MGFKLRLVNWNPNEGNVEPPIGRIVSEGSDDAVPIEFHFDLSERIQDQDDNPYVTTSADIPLNNVQYGVMGTEENPVIRAKLYNNGEDKSNGTIEDAGMLNPDNDQYDSRFVNVDQQSGVVTRRQMRIFLKEYIRNTQQGAQWRLEGGRYTNYYNIGRNAPVTIQNMNIVRDVNGQMFDAVEIRLRLGQRFLGT